MAEAAITTTTLPASNLIAHLGRDANPLLARAQQDVKSAVHRELIGKVDLEKLLYMQDTRAAAIAGSHSATGRRARSPIQRSERTRLANEVMDEVFGWARWSRCCRTPPSPTFWSTPPTPSTWSAAACWRQPMSCSRTTIT